MSADDSTQNGVTEISEKEIDSLRQKNIEGAQALLEIIEKVKSKQDRWQVVLSDAMTREREEELECERIFKRVTLSQMQMATQGNDFTDWLDSKGTSIGVSKLSAWYHDDILARATPYYAVLPLPLNLSEQGKLEFLESFESLAAGNEMFVENIPFCDLNLMQSAVALGILGSSAARGQGKLASRCSENEKNVSTAEYLDISCKSGEDILQMVDKFVLLKSALKNTPCVFLNDFCGDHGSSTALRRRGKTEGPVVCALVRCILIRGDLIAAEGVPSTYNQKSGDKIFDSTSFGESLEAFVRSLAGPSSCLFERSVSLILSSHFESSYSFYLLSVSVFDGSNTDHFTLNELLLLAEYRSALRYERARNISTVDQTALDVSDSSGLRRTTRLVVRMAGSNWAEISSAVLPKTVTLGPSGSNDKCSRDPEEVLQSSQPPSKKLPEKSSLSPVVVSALMTASAIIACGVTIALTATKKMGK